jgi:hypothetical protein
MVDRGREHPQLGKGSWVTGQPPPIPTARGVPQGELEAWTYLMADVANTCPLEPTQRTTMEATTTMRSEEEQLVRTLGMGPACPWEGALLLT